MTYHYKYWSAFNEADLLNAGDHSLGLGDTFVMPGAATVTLASYDNDGQLSGDYNDVATDSDGHYDQYGWSNNGSGWVQTGDLYVEKVYTLHGSDGKTYYLAEIEGEHKAENEDFFSFVGGTPPAGVSLSIASCSDSHGVNYSDLSADPSQPPANVAPVFDNLPENGVIHLDENEAHVIDINASDADGDTLTYSIVGGADANFFAIDPATGDLCFKSAPDFENAQDGGANNVYDVTVKVTDGNGGSSTKTLWVKIQDVDEHVNTAPVFDNLPANGVICVDENNAFVVDVNASDVDGDNLTFSITGGADADAFTIDAHTGELVFNTAPDFENPTSNHLGNNTYDVTVTVTDGNGGTTTKPLWIKVKDVDENTGGELECIVVEAEDMDLYNMSVVHGSQASGGQLVRTSHLGGTGDLTTTFNGEGGTYDLSIFAQDETDGQSSIMVKVNGVLVEAFKLDRETDGAGSNNSGFTEFVVEGVDLANGDEVMIWVDGDAGEWVRIDKIKFQQVEDVNPDLVCLEFNGLNAGDVVNTQFDGVMISAQRDGEGGSGSNSPNDAMIFDSSNPTGGDHDLETANQGNILIISEDNDSSDPDDNAGGGTIWFKFDNPAEVESIKVIDSEEGGKIRLLDENGQLIKEVIIPGGVDNGIQTVEINAEGVAQIDLTLNGSGAIDDLKYIPGDAPETGSLGGTYFMDNNDNSVEDAGDMAVAGATVWLLQNGVVIDSTTTDANGDYLFDDLAPGDYAVRFDEQDGKSFVDGNVGGNDTIDSDVVNVGGAGNGNTAPVTVGAGEDVRNVDAGVELIDTGDAQISGRITFDDDDDDTETNTVGGGFDEGFGGKTVELLDENGDVIDSTTTAADGSYSFTGLSAGTYSVNFPDTMGLTIADKGVGDEHQDSDANPDGQTDPIVVAIGDNIPNIDLSLQDPADASLGGRIFMDSDDDSQDNGNGDEAPAPGVTVRLLDAAGNELDTAVTDANGEYLFENLKAGDYKVDFPTEVGGKILVDQNVGNDLSDSDASQTTGETGVVSVGISEDVRDVDAGVEDPGTAAINGRLFMDANDNSQDDNEMGVAGVTVDLLDENGDVIDSTTTGADGSYSFTGLGAGEYAVSFPTEVDGKVLVEQNVGPDATDSDADQGTGNTDPIVLEIGDVSNNNDAGIEDPNGSAIEGVVFMDNNDDSQNNAGDMPVSGVPVDLLDENGDVIDSTTTGADGSYSFTGLAAGTYSVTFPTEVDGKVLVDSNVGPDTTDSDADEGTGNTGPITVGINETSSNNDAGIEDPGTASLAGKVFMDNNDDSQNNAGDMAVGGVTVELLDVNGDVIDSTTTGPDGAYEFTDLDAGSYSVRFPTTVDGKTLVDSNVGPDATDSDANQLNGETPVVELGIGERSENNDAGFDDPGTASVAGRYFMDMNDNSRDDDEPAVAGATVWLIKQGEGIVASMTTDANGEYLFEGLDAGNYRVRFEDPTDVAGQEGKVFVDANVGDDVNDSDAEVDDSDVTIVGSAGNGNTVFFPVEIGDAITDVDAGIEDPGTAAIGDTVFLDENGNGQQDLGEDGVAGVDVTVFDEDGNVAGTATTDADGNYLVDGLDAGTYTVGFEEVDGFDFTTANAPGSNDANDSDADQTTGVTGAVTLEIGETDLTVDAGLVAENEDPTAGDDEGMVCALEAVSINVLANDADPDGDVISVAHVNGEELEAGESTTLDSGAVVTLLANGELSYDSSSAVLGGVAAADIVQGETASDSFTYSITDGNGGTATGTVDVTVKGDKDTIDTILSSAPTSGTATFSGYSANTAYTAVLSNTGDARYDGLVIEAAYCLEFDADFFNNTDVTVDISGALDSLQEPGDFISDVDGNLDLINWIINQDFTSQSNGDVAGVGAGQNYTDTEIQAAIWGITDDRSQIAEGLISSIEDGQLVQTYNGTQANVQEIIDAALANGEGFIPGDGDLFTLILNPTDVQGGAGEANDFDQAFIVALPFDDFKEDCIC